MPDPLSSLVGEIMTTPVKTVRPEASLAEVAEILIGLHVSGLPSSTRMGGRWGS